MSAARCLNPLPRNGKYRNEIDYANVARMIAATRASGSAGYRVVAPRLMSRRSSTGKWVRARYVVERREIAARYAVWEIVGEPEYRQPIGGAFTP